MPHESLRGVSYIHSVTFPDGSVLSLRALFCQATYTDHQEGASTRQTNDARIEALAGQATALFGPTPIHLVQPTRTLGRAIDGRGIEGEPVRRETLPPLCCIGDFEADLAAGPGRRGSGLVVVWFQSEPPPVPIEPDLVNLFHDIPWDDLAASYWY